MLISEQSETFLKDFLALSIGAGLSLEAEVRFNLARLLLRYYKLVLKGEEDNSPTSENLRSQLVHILEPLKDEQGEVAQGEKLAG